MSEPTWEQPISHPMGQPSWQQPPAPLVPGPETMLGDIGISRTHVFLPSGVQPIVGTQWTMTDATYATQKISNLGIILAVVLFPVLCVFSLFFLMMKDLVVQGQVQVQVSGPGFGHSTFVYAAGPMTAPQVAQTVNWARTCAGEPAR